jgi:hypothetical protein
MIIDTGEIKRRLYEDVGIRNRLIRDYGLDYEPPDPESFACALLLKLGQAPVKDPLSKTYSNNDVFRAAVRAIGSNSRTWATFLLHETQLSNLLYGYDPEHTNNAVEQGILKAHDLKLCLPGQSSSKDAAAILCWARLLAETCDYYAFVSDLGLAFSHLAEAVYKRPLSNADFLLCVAGYLGKPPAAWSGEQFLGSAGRSVILARRKTPGMSYTLASEFLRNLGWTGFKPDRHVIRLFDNWLPYGTAEVDSQVQDLVQLIGNNPKDLHVFLAYSSLGIRISPPGVPHSHVDNLIWLLGAYVEKKNHESEHTYLK